MVQKKPMNVWAAEFGNIIISKLVETKNDTKYLTAYLDEVIKSLVLLLPKIIRYVKTFRDKSENDKNNKLMFLLITDNKLLEKYNTIWNKIENFKNIKLDALPVYDNRYIKPK